VALRSGLKAQVHAVLAKCGVAVRMSDVFDVGGTLFLDGLDLPGEYGARVASLRRLIDMLTFEIDIAGRRVHARLGDHAGWRVIQALLGVGPVLAAVFVAEMGDVHRFAGPEALTCWAGLTPKHRESDATVHRGRITKQGNRAVRWAAIEAVQRVSTGPAGAVKARVGAHRGKNVAKVAAARKLLLTSVIAGRHPPAIYLWRATDGYGRVVGPSEGLTACCWAGGGVLGSGSRLNSTRGLPTSPAWRLGVAHHLVALHTWTCEGC
jgi:transposase